MDTERALVSKIISTGQLEDAISKGVRADLIVDDECRDVFEYVSAHMRRYKAPPSLSAVQDDKPDFEWEHTQDPLDYICDKFLKLAKRRLAQEMVVELAQLTEDPKEEDLDLRFIEVSRKLATLVPSTEVSRFKEGFEKRIDQYEKDVKEGHRPGIPFGFPKLDEWTGGIQPHELVTISGFSGLGKSTLSMVIAHNAFMKGHTPLIISLEMEARQMLRKFDAMTANLDYKGLKQLGLTRAAIEGWRDKVKEIQAMSSEIPILDKIRHCTPDHVFAETIRHKPDLVVIDYITLMRSGRPSRSNSMWQSVTEVTQDLKQNARTLGVPILAMAQTNRAGGKDGAELDNIGYAISVVQDSDIVIGLYADDEMKERKEMEIRLNKNRDDRLGKFTSIWNHDKMLFREKDLFERNRDERQEEDPTQSAIERIAAQAKVGGKRRKRPGS